MSTKYPESFYGDKKYCCVCVYILIARQWHTHTHTGLPRGQSWQRNEKVRHATTHTITTPLPLFLFLCKSTLQNDSVCGMKLPPHAACCLAVGATTPYIHSHIRFHFHPSPFHPLSDKMTSRQVARELLLLLLLTTCSSARLHFNVFSHVSR